METFCENHPEQTTKKHCFYCKKNICSECQRIYQHHIFCSRKCFLLFTLSEISGKVKRFLGKLIPFRFRANQQKWNIVSILRTLLVLQLIVVFFLVASILINILFFRQIKVINQELGRFKESRETVSPTRSDDFRINEFPIEQMVTRNFLQIEGETSSNCVVTLEANGNVIASVVPQNDFFVFENIPVKRDYKTLLVKAISPDGQILALETIRLDFASPTSEYLAKNFTRGIQSEKQIALTFDGDYLNNMADSILTILQDRKIPATFFLTGRFIEKYPETVRRIVADGHVVGNHTWRHPHLTQYESTRKHDLHPDINREKLHSELKKTAELFEEITGKSMSRYWRAPYGEHNYQIRLWAAELGYRQIGWTRDRRLKLSLDTMDWVADENSPLYQNPQDILNNILKFEAQSEFGMNGGIVLMHLGSLREADYPFEVIDTIIDELKSRGYVFVSIPQMHF